MTATGVTQASVEHVRKITANTIALVAQYKYELEQLRVDPDASAEKISIAARRYREAESEMRTAIDKEIEVLIAFAQRVARGEVPDPRKSPETERVEGQVPVERTY